MSRCSRMTLWVRQYRSRLRAHSHCGSRTTGSSVVDTKDDVRICRKGRCGARAGGMKPHDSAVLSSAFERREPLCGRFGHGGLLAGPVGARQGPGSTDAGGRGARTSGLRSMSPGSSPGAAPRLRPPALAAAAASLMSVVESHASPPALAATARPTRWRARGLCHASRARGCGALRHRDSGGAARQPSAPPAACRGSAVQVAPSAGTVPLTRKPIVAAVAQLPIAPPCP